MARLQITTIGDVLREIRVAVVPGDATLPDQIAEGHTVHLRKFGSLPECEGALSVECDRKLSPEPLPDLPLGNAKALKHRIRDIQHQSHTLTTPLFR